MRAPFAVPGWARALNWRAGLVRLARDQTGDLVFD